MRIFVAIYFAFLIAGCNAEHELRLKPNEAIKVWVKPSMNGVFTISNLEETIMPGAPKHDKFMSWVENNRGGWEWTPASYISGKVVVSGNGYSFNFLGEAVVLNYEVSSGKYEQLIKNVDPKSYEFLLQK